MANPEHLQILQQGVEAWNAWRARNWVNFVPDFTEVVLIAVDLAEADLRGVNLTGANLAEADLRGVNLTRANLTDAVLRGTNLTRADLTGADLSWTDLIMAISAGPSDPGQFWAKRSSATPT
jgi:uncharacterized protein YjbI with pentapeptide repeats